MNKLMNSAMGLLAGAVCLGLLGGPALAAEDGVAPANSAAGPAATAPAVSAASPVNPAADPTQRITDYQIGASDLLEISVFQVPDMSRTVRVNSHGLISLPLIGVVKAGGLTAQELEAAIAQKLAESLLQDPQVSVFIKEFVSQRVTVEGSVAKPGVYPLTGRTTLLQVIALASGVDLVAEENAVKVFRQNGDDANGGRTALIYDLEAIRAGRVEDPLIQGNDLVVVEKSGARSALKGVTDTLRGFFSFGRY
ncbi:MAG: polysaccharide biosynthesis/export family protein [Rugosibacter sp.]